MVKFMKWAFPGLAIAGGILALTPVAAQASSVLVSYNDLDLASPYGVATLQQRVNRAVTAVCGKGNSGESLSVTQDIQRCRTDALRGAQLQMAFVANKSRQLAGREGAVVIASR